MTLKNDPSREAAAGLDPATEEGRHRAERGMDPERWEESERADERLTRLAATPEEARRTPEREGPLARTLEEQDERVEEQGRTRPSPGRRR